MLAMFEKIGGVAGNAAGWRELCCLSPWRSSSRRARASRSSGERPLLAGWGVILAGFAASLRAQVVCEMCVCVCALRLA